MSRTNIPAFYIVIPCYNEEEIIPITLPAILQKLQSLIDKKVVTKDSKVLTVDDGSKDSTWDLLTKTASIDNRLIGVKLAGNRGQQPAMICGMNEAIRRGADIVVTMDVDLQDDINVIDEMIDKYMSGADIVYGVRKARKKDSFLKKFTAEGFYKVMNLFGANIIYNHSEYRLMSRRVVEALKEYKEVNLFLRGLVQMTGYPYGIVYYDRDKRVAGKSKYSIKKMLSLAYEGITSLTVTPLKIIKRVGIFNFVLGAVAFILFMILKYVHPIDSNNLWILISSIMMFTGLEMTALSFVGDYVGKIYQETKHRPKYFIDKTTNEE